MTAAEALAVASAIYAAILLATYFYLVRMTPGCRGRVLSCVKAEELAVIALIVAVQTAVMALVAFLAS